jgi:heme-degrading monooxygenase HmoA
VSTADVGTRCAEGDLMIVEHAEFLLVPGAGPEFEAAFAGARHLLLGAPGCRGAQLLPSVDRDDTYLLQVQWERLEDHTEDFPGTEAAAELVAALTPHCLQPPRVTHYDATRT